MTCLVNPLQLMLQPRVCELTGYSRLNGARVKPSTSQQGSTPTAFASTRHAPGQEDSARRLEKLLWQFGGSDTPSNGMDSRWSCAPCVPGPCGPGEDSAS